MPKNHYERWTEEEIESVMRLRTEGKTDREIAHVLGRSVSAVTNAVHRERKKIHNNISQMIYHAAKDRQPTILDRIKHWLGIGT